MRNRNTNEKGDTWTQNEIEQVWKKGLILPDYPSDCWRLDICGNMMKFAEHGNTDSQFGWEIDHLNAVSEGGKDNIENLQPLNWINNQEKDNQLNLSYVHYQ